MEVTGHGNRPLPLRGSHMVTILCYVNFPSQSIPERSRKAIFRDFRSENKMIALIKMQKEKSINELCVSTDQLNTKNYAQN